MPFGPNVLGVAYFAGIKLAGYSAAGAYVNRHEAVAQPRPIVFGVARTALGLTVGVAYALSVSRLDITNGEFAFYIGLVPLRILEWLGILWLFYRAVPDRTRWPRYVAAGIGWSFFLDLPAIFAAFALPGGVWIC